MERPQYEISLGSVICDRYSSVKVNNCDGSEPRRIYVQKDNLAEIVDSFVRISEDPGGLDSCSFTRGTYATDIVGFLREIDMLARAKKAKEASVEIIQ